jgi:hypothetical protein
VFLVQRECDGERKDFPPEREWLKQLFPWVIPIGEDKFISVLYEALCLTELDFIEP